MLLTQVLKLSLLVTLLSLLVFQFLLSYNPEVVNSLSLVLVKTSKIFFFPDLFFKESAFLTE
jgi:hypothetical protein